MSKDTPERSRGAEPKSTRRSTNTAALHNEEKEARDSLEVRESIEGQAIRDDAHHGRPVGPPRGASKLHSGEDQLKSRGGSHDSTYGSSSSAPRSPSSHATTPASASEGTEPEAGTVDIAQAEGTTTDKDDCASKEGVPSIQLPLFPSHISESVQFAHLLTHSDPANTSDKQAIDSWIEGSTGLKDLLGAEPDLTALYSKTCLPQQLGGYSFDQLENLEVLEAVQNKIGELIRDSEDAKDTSPSRSSLRHEPIKNNFNSSTNRLKLKKTGKLNFTYKEFGQILSYWGNIINAQTDHDGNRIMTLPALVDMVRSESHEVINDIHMIGTILLYIIKRCATHSGYTCDKSINTALAQPGTVIMVSMFFANAANGKLITDPDTCPTTEGGASQKEALSIVRDNNCANIMHHTITSGNGDFLASKPPEEQHKYVEIFNQDIYDRRRRYNELPARYLIVQNLCPPRNGLHSWLYLVSLPYALSGAMRAYDGLYGQVAFLDAHNLAKFEGYVLGLQLLNNDHCAVVQKFDRKQLEVVNQCKEEYYSYYRGYDELDSVEDLEQQRRDVKQQRRDVEQQERDLAKKEKSLDGEIARRKQQEQIAQRQRETQTSSKRSRQESSPETENKRRKTTADGSGYDRSFFPQARASYEALNTFGAPPMDSNRPVIQATAQRPTANPHKAWSPSPRRPEEDISSMRRHFGAANFDSRAPGSGVRASGQGGRRDDQRRDQRQDQYRDRGYHPRHSQDYHRKDNGPGFVPKPKR